MSSLINIHGAQIIVTLLVLLHGTIKAQTITPQVINSAGDHRQVGNTGITITDNVGEPFTQSIGPNGWALLTQGFIQPGVLSIGGFSYSAPYQSPACAERNDDAFISVLLTAPVPNYSVKYFWTPSSVCPNNDCPKVENVKPGSYRVKVVVSYTSSLGNQLVDTLKSTDFLIETAKNPCKIIVYTGITPNGDGVNDTWTIDNITDYPNNRVTIYSRWGDQLAEIKGYNNAQKYWPRKDQLDFLSSTTYFYVIELEEGGNPIKGWVELIKNQ